MAEPPILMLDVSLPPLENVIFYDGLICGWIQKGELAGQLVPSLLCVCCMLVL